MPSSCDDTFLFRCRFAVVEDAVAAARTALAKGLWMLHIQGPDDIVAAPSRAEADVVAAAFNALHGARTEKHRDEIVAEDKDASHYAEVKAVVHGWCRTPQAHAKSVERVLAGVCQVPERAGAKS